MNKTEEIRFLLMGRLTVLEDGRVVENEQGWHSGLPDGWSWLRLFGLSRRAQNYTADLPEEELRRAGIEALQHIGHMLVMSEAPMVPAALYRSWSTEYALLTAEVEDDKLILTAFCGRSPVGGFKCRRLLKKCAEFLPEGVEPVYTAQEKDEKKKKKSLRERLGGLVHHRTAEEKQAAREARLKAAEERAARRSAKRAEQAEKAAKRAEEQAAKAMQRAEEARRSAAAAAEHTHQEENRDETSER